MKYITIFLFLICGILFSAEAQNKQHLFKWEALTLSGGAFVGVTNTRNNALVEIEKLMHVMSEDKAILDFEIRFSTIENNSKTSLLDEFSNYTEQNKKFTFLSREDIEAIRIHNTLGKPKCIAYYENATQFENKATMLHYLENKVLVFKKFIFISPTKDTLGIQNYSAYQKSFERK